MALCFSDKLSASFSTSAIVAIRNYSLGHPREKCSTIDILRNTYWSVLLRWFTLLHAMTASERVRSTEDPSSDLRIVLLDAGAEKIWVRESQSGTSVRCQPGDWTEATRWLHRCITSGEGIPHFASWAAGRLGLSPSDIVSVSAPFREGFAAQLVDRVPEAERTTAQLCSEGLGWIKPTNVSFDKRWAALSLILPHDDMPRLVLDVRGQVESALEPTDQMAVAGIPVGLRVNPTQWWKFLSSEDWSRSATRWRTAPVLSSGPPIAPSLEQSGTKTTDWVEKHVPNALPLLQQARAAVLAEANAKPPTEDDARSAAEAFLFAILNHRPQTRNRFRLNVSLDFHFGTRPAEGDLVATDARLVIEVDGYYHFRGQEAYRRDRRKDAALQEHRWFVIRFLAEDVVCDVQNVVEQIEYMLARRDATRLR
jgi:very-short-patch-repair endonuclease